MFEILQALFMGVVEGLTEFLPVSSTGHLILTGELIGFTGDRAKVFDVFIQLGAILAVVWLYREKIFKSLAGILGEKKYLSFWMNIVLAFMPSAVFGLLLHGFIKKALFSPLIVAISLFVGGVLIIIIEKSIRKVRIDEIFSITSRDALIIGLCQVLSLVPGVSRSGATIMGALVIGLSRGAAAEFSFFLAIPTMFAATAYDLYKSRDILHFSDGWIFAAGFISAFISAAIVIKWFVSFISRSTFKPFAYYRIVFGAALFIFLMLNNAG